MSRPARRAAPRRVGVFRRLTAFAAAAAASVVATLGASGDAAAQGLIRDTELERTVTMLTRPIFKVAGLPEGTVSIFIINDPSLNAFVTGGRTMVLHTGILSELETPEQIMGVLAHEAGHITGGHIFRRIEAVENASKLSIVTLLAGIGAAVAGGGSGGVAVSSAGQSVVQRALLRFTRGQEASADQAALAYLNDAGVDPQGMLEVLTKLGRNEVGLIGQINPYLLTHPLSSQRVQLLQDGVAKSPARGRRLPDSIYYWHARMRAKIDGFLGRLDGFNFRSFGNEELDLYREAIRLHRLPAPDRAVAAADRLIAMRPDDPYYRELKGFFLSESGRGPQAVAPYREAYARSNEAPLIGGGLGAALLTLNTPEADAEALRILERAAIQDQFDTRMRRSLAIAYDRAGDDGMAAVVTAERLLLQGAFGDARIQAQRAKRLLPPGSPGALRADDVLAVRPPRR